MRHRNKGFTLIELLIVIGVISVIAGIIITQVDNSINSGRDSRMKGDINIIRNALVAYRSDNYYRVPQQAVACNISGGCSASIDPVLDSYSVKVSNPVSGQYYTYQSVDGSNCTVSATLSNGTKYQYDCGSDSFSIVN
jgi:prepilin-type N-terminal cleavage/methylation domain-containing protein